MSKNNWFMTPEGKDYLEQNYVPGLVSIPEIAKEHFVYPNLIYRALKFWGIPRKNRSDAQRNAIKNGTAKHPTAGQKRPRQTKRNIGRGVYKTNLKLTEEEKQNRIDKCREIWYNKDEKTREEYTKRSHKKIREAGRKGSKFEQYLVAALLTLNYKVQVHHELSFADSKKNVDIYLPYEGICIEIDGPVHFEPIFGEEALAKQIESDLEKNELVMAEGYSLIRIQNPKGFTSTSFVEDFIKGFIPFLKKIAAEEKNSFHEVVVTDFLEA